jgi:hypothetical protein
VELKGGWESSRRLEPQGVRVGKKTRQHAGFMGVGVRHAVRDGEDESLCGRSLDSRATGPWPGSAPHCQECRALAKEEIKAD